MSDAEAPPNRAIAFLSQIPNWLWATGLGSLTVFSCFLFYLSQHSPDQYAMTKYPPWQHTMNHKELIAYHRALKAGIYNGEELDAKKFLYRQGTSNQLYAAKHNSTTNHPHVLTRNTPNRSLTMEQALGFASHSKPVNNYSLQQAQHSIALERNKNGMIATSHITSNIPAGIYIQTASLRSMRDAGRLRETLKARGFSPFIQEAFVKNQRWYRVRFGPFPTMSDARQAAKELQAKRYSAQVIHHK